MQIKFPPSFLWGAAISSYQTEGGNYNSDWCLWEKKKKLEEAGKACDHYHLFKKDFQLAKELNLNSLRFSIEWARICPAPGIYLEEEIDHYRKVLDALADFNLKPFVSLHHFTNPIWFARAGSWLHYDNIDFFLAYLHKIVESLKDKVEYWLIFNEPLVYIYNSFILGIWPPGITSVKEARKALNNITNAYISGYREIKSIYKENNLTAQVSFAKHMRVFSPCTASGTVLNCASSFLRDRIFNFRLLDYLVKKDCLDYIAINYYCKEYVKFKGFLGIECGHDSHQERKNSLGWYTCPQGLYELLIKTKKFDLPVFVMENGTAENQDTLYRDYLFSHLINLEKAISQGVNVKGYLWWSLLDNFEWDKGFKPRFGLIEVDYQNLGRKIRPFAYAYAKICKENKLEIKPQ